MDIPQETSIAIIRERISLWTNSQYAAALDVRVAKKIGDDKMENSAIENMKRCEAAIMELEAALKEIKSDPENPSA